MGTYEVARQQRLQDNKRRLEELGLASLSKTLSNSFKKTKPFSAKSPTKPRKKIPIPSELLEQRRSTRISNKPAPMYKEMDDNLRQPRRSVTRRSYTSNLFISDHARDEAAEEASRIQTENPSFVKRMLPSHVSSCFWLGLPLAFCKAHLPKNDQYMTLVIENGEKWESLYLARKTGLSAGWKRFAEDNRLGDGDALLFELVEWNRFKVHIIRVKMNDSAHEGTDDEDGQEDDRGSKPEA